MKINELIEDELNSLNENNEDEDELLIKKNEIENKNNENIIKEQIIPEILATISQPFEKRTQTILLPSNHNTEDIINLSKVNG